MCVCARALSRQTLGDPRDYSPPGSSVMEFYRQEYWSGLPFPTPGDLPNPGVQTQGSNPHLLCLLHWQADSLPLDHLGVLIIKDIFPVFEKLHL